MKISNKKAMSYKPLALSDKLNISKTKGNRMKDFQELKIWELS